MASDKLGYHQDKYEVIGRFNSSDAKHKRTDYLVTIPLHVIALICWAVLFKISKISIPVSLFCVLVYICILLFHELFHFIPIWLFSKQKPQICFKFVENYVILRPNASVSRIEGLIAYLLPSLMITVILGVITRLTNFTFMVILMSFIILHLGMCCHDFLDSCILLKYRGNNVRLAHEKHKKGFNTVFYLDKPDI